MLQQGGAWTAGQSFPRPGVAPTRLYLTAESSSTADHCVHDGSLSTSPAPGVSSLHVRPDSRGLRSRDMTQVTAGATLALGADFARDARYQERGARSRSHRPPRSAAR